MTMFGSENNPRNKACRAVAGINMPTLVNRWHLSMATSVQRQAANTRGENCLWAFTCLWISPKPLCVSPSNGPTVVSLTTKLCGSTDPYPNVKQLDREFDTDIN